MEQKNQNAIVSRHRLSDAQAVVCADGSASLLNVTYQGSEFIIGNGTLPHPLRLSAEAQKRYDAYPKLVEALRSCVEADKLRAFERGQREPEFQHDREHPAAALLRELGG